MVIDPEDDYEMIYHPYNGFCQVEKDGKFGYINEDGDLIIPLKYEGVYEFAENGLAYVSCENGRGGYINEKDEFVIEPVFHSGTIFNYGKAAVSKNGEYIFIDELGRKSIDHTFKYAGRFSECGLAKIELLDGRQGFIRPDGHIEFILEEGWEVQEFIANKKITQLRIGEKTGLINNQGEIILMPCYEDIEISRHANSHPFCQDGLWGYIDDNGRMVIDNICEKASTFSEDNLAFVEIYDPEEDEIQGLYINTKGKIVDGRLMDSFYMSFGDKYSRLYGFYNGLALAEKKEKRKILNSYGEEIPYKDFNLPAKNGIILIESR